MRYIIPFLITLALLKLYESILDDMAHKDLSDKDSIIVNAENNNNNMNYKKKNMSMVWSVWLWLTSQQTLK